MTKQDFINKWIGWVSYAQRDELTKEMEYDLEAVSEQLRQSNVRRSFIGRLLCKIGWHRFTCKMQDCIDEFGYVPNDSRIPKVAKCCRCGKNYG